MYSFLASSCILACHSSHPWCNHCNYSYCMKLHFMIFPSLCYFLIAKYKCFRHSVLTYPETVYMSKTSCIYMEFVKQRDIISSMD
jgi:hypothetical protein